MPEIPGLESKTIEVVDGDPADGGRTLTVLLTKMDCLSASEWLMRLGVALAKAGIRYSGGKARQPSAEEVIAEMLEKKDGGEVFFQLPNLQLEDIQTLLTKMIMSCQIVREDPVTHKQTFLSMSEQNIRANIRTLECLWHIRWEAIKYNFDFFGKGGNSLFSHLKSSLNPLNIRTSAPSSAS